MSITDNKNEGSRRSGRLLAALAVLAVAFVVLAAVPAVATDSDADATPGSVVKGEDSPVTVYAAGLISPGASTSNVYGDSANTNAVLTSLKSGTYDGTGVRLLILNFSYPVGTTGITLEIKVSDTLTKYEDLYDGTAMTKAGTVVWYDGFGSNVSKGQYTMADETKVKGTAEGLTNESNAYSGSASYAIAITTTVGNKTYEDTVNWSGEGLELFSGANVTLTGADIYSGATLTVDEGATIAFSDVKVEGTVDINGSASGNFTSDAAASFSLGEKAYSGATVYSVDGTTVSATVPSGGTLSIEGSNNYKVENITTDEYGIDGTTSHTAQSVTLVLNADGEIAGTVNVPAYTKLTVGDTTLRSATISAAGKIDVKENAVLLVSGITIEEKGKLNIGGVITDDTTTPTEYDQSVDIENAGTVYITSQTAVIEDLDISSTETGSVQVTVQETGTLQTGTVSSLTEVGFYQYYTATSDVTFKGADLIVEGELIINEGVTLTVTGGAHMIVLTATGKLVNNGTIVLEGAAGYETITGEAAMEVRSNGILTNNGTIRTDAAETTPATVLITSAVENAGSISIGEDASLLIGDGGALTNTGSLQIEGAIAQANATGSIVSSGSITLAGVVGDGTNDAFSVDLSSTSAVVIINGAFTCGAKNTTITVNSAIGTTKNKIEDGSTEVKVVLNGNANKTTNAGPTAASVEGNKGLTLDGLTIGVSTVKVSSTTYSELTLSGSIDVSVIDDDVRTSSAESASTESYVTVTTAGYAAVTGALSVPNHASLVLGGKAYISGTLTVANSAGADVQFVDTEVSGTVTKGAAGEITATELAVSGKITSVSTKIASPSGESTEYNGAMYFIKKDSSVADTQDQYVYTTLATAIADAATDITLYGENKISSDLVVPSGTTVTNAEGAELTVAAVVTFADGAVLKNSASISVSGALVITTTKTGLKDSGSISSPVVLTDDASTTYSGLAYALNEASATGGTVKVGDEYAEDSAPRVTVSESTEIPAGVTLDMNEHALIIAKNATLTVNGVLELTGSAATITLEQKTDGSTDASGKLVLNGQISADHQLAYDSTASKAVAGAYYSIESGSEETFYISTVPYAAGIITAVKDGTVDVYGVSSLGSLAVTGSSSVKGIVNLYGKATASTITLSNASVVVKGAYTLAGTIASANGSVVLNGTAVSGFKVSDVTSSSSETLTVSGGFTAGDDGRIEFIGDVVLSAVDLDAATITGNAEVAKGSTIGGLYVDGTLTVDNAVSLSGEYIVVSGTLNVAEAVAATSTTEAKAQGTAQYQAAFIGIEPSDAVKNNTGTDASATGNLVIVTGESDLTIGKVTTVPTGLAVSAAGATVPAAFTEADGDYTATSVMVGNAIVMIAYTVSGSDATLADLNVIIENATADGTYTDSDGNTVESTTSLNTLSGAVTANAKYDIYSVTIIADAGVGSVALNGIILTNDGGNTFKTSEDSKLVAGDYTVTLTANSGWSTSADKIVDASGNTVSSIVLSGSTTDLTYYISGSTQTSSDTPTPTPTPAVVEDNDDNDLTDILLIVLIVLAVVLAALVALRLMRS